MNNNVELSTDEIESAVLHTLDKDGTIADTGVFTASRGWPHDDTFVGVLLRLESLKAIKKSVIEKDGIKFSEEAEDVLINGSAEAQVFHAIPAEGIKQADLESKLGKNVTKVGLGKAMKNKWTTMDKASGLIKKQVMTIEDTTREQLEAIKKHPEKVEKATFDELKKRTLVSNIKIKTFKVEKGEKFTLNVQKEAADLTVEMLESGSWEKETFKNYKLDVMGMPGHGGHLHPLLKVRTQIRQILLEMGFEEMPTNNWVESSFWNFDALFQPQQHPARDAHDTFFLSDPAEATKFPQDYLNRVKEMHTHGGNGSIGWRYDWKVEEAKKNILRTHTTAVSSRMLYDLAQKGFQPKKYFSIDRVFRNEAMDATHLAEFSQVEGLIADKNLSLANLMGIITEFFNRLGITDLRFKPAFNPYTEPSMEVFGFHPGLGRWVELGNSGMFRPEMLQPMGLPEDVRVIAWGLSLERPTMIKYGIKNIRDLVGHKISLNFIKNNALCRFDD